MSENISSKPFYMYPMGQTRGIQIIREVKAEIKKMETSRPSTPFSTKSMIKTTSFTPRPSSNISIKSLQYEVNEKSSSSTVKLEPLCSNKMFQETDELKLEPIVKKTNFTVRKGSTTPKKNHIESEFHGFPPIDLTDKSTDHLTSSAGNKTAKNYPFVNGSESDNSSLLGDLPNVDYNCTTYYYESSSHPTEHEISDTTLECSDDDSRSNIKSNPNSSDIKEYCSGGEFTIEIANLLPKLSRHVKLGMKKTGEILELVDDIYDLLKKHDMFDKLFEERVPILKEFFRLLSSDTPVLSLKIASIVLKMNITDKNLVNVLKIILRLKNAESVNLNDSDIFDSLLIGTKDLSIGSNRDAVFYMVLIYKHYICEKFIDQAILTDQVLPIIFSYLSEFNLMNLNTKELAVFETLLIDIGTVLHNLVDNQSYWNILIEEGQILQIFKALNKCINQKEVVQIMIRIISKIADKSDGCNTIALCDQNIPTKLLPLFVKYKYELDIFLQLAFIVGNLVAIDDKQALDFITYNDFQNILLSILEEYVYQHTEGSITTIKHKMWESAGDQNWSQLIVEAILQNLHIWANLCLSAKAGCFLANKMFITRLLSIADIYKSRNVDSSDNCLVLGSVLVVISNTSYYLSSNSEQLAIEMAECIIPLLDDDQNFEIRLEAASIVRNLTRSSHVRSFIREHSLYPAFIQLLDEDHKELTTIAYGIIMNILIDYEACQPFYNQKGISRVIHKLHLCSGRDWKISAHLCQILWNFCSNKLNEQMPLSSMEVKHLIKFLSYSLMTDEGKDPDNEAYESSEEYSWKLEFCSVAKKLLNLLKNDKTSP